MNPHRPCLGSASVVLGITVALVLGVMVPHVDAKVGGQATAVWPSTAAVGTTFDATVTISNQSPPPDDTENILVLDLFVTPACASSESPVCLAPNTDPGVFDILSAVGDAGSTPCAGITFSIGSSNPASGEFRLTPSQTVTLGPASGPLSARTCQVNLSLLVKKFPANPAFPSSGLTNALALVTLHAVTSDLNGAASSTAQITVTPEPPVPPSPAPPQNVPTLSELAEGILAGFLMLGGAAVLRRRKR